MDKFMIIGERIHCISPVIRKAIEEKDLEPIFHRAKEQIDAGAHYIDVNIGPAERGGEDIMTWMVEGIQQKFDNIPLALDTVNKNAIIAGLKVYNNSRGKAIINSADAGPRIEMIDLAGEYNAMVIGLCAKEGIPRDNDERMMYCTEMLERAMEAGMEPTDVLFDPLMLVIKGMQDKQQEVLEAIRMISEMGLKTTGGLSNISNGAPKNIRPILDSVWCSMAIQNGLSSAIINPCDVRLMETIKSADIIKANTLYADSYLEL